MHLVNDEPIAQMNKLRSEMSSSTPKNSLGSALKNKIKGVASKARSMAGAPGRAAFKVYDKAVNEPKRKESDYEYNILKSYNDYKKSGRAPIPSKPNSQGATGDQRMIAEYERIKDKLSK